MSAPSRWATVVPLQRVARERANALGHWLTAWEVDDPEHPLDSRVAECRRCGRLAAVETEEGLLGQALDVACDGTMAPGRAMIETGPPA